VYRVPTVLVKKISRTFQDPRSIFPGRRQDNGLLYCSCAHCSTPYTAQYTLVLVYSKYYSSKLHALPNNLPKPTVNKGRIAGCIMQ